ncbi:MAG: hypothetical protein KME28_17640 [Pelatocladus maniniholoensis HA4357-MV3]|jgi:copper chaperone CopZ|uniref:Heavy metal translocating P-type ATPase n=1 Tax=Pelatocladus maniniholoensis HA4357-MV3 TaxID=1117104 RepID=A0A9E3H9T2_9NOST|nr:hypothetical protein [Pelatocladus maniniholoensis HA4357-MV3]BAZ68991.1 hypothetical protein NIES4106_37600 [Fischerella sp. NIES-4106]
MTVQSERIDYQVVHAITGRIRIKIPSLRIDPDYADKLQRLVKSLGAVTHVHINYASASIVIEYNTIGIENKAIHKELANCIQQAGGIGADVSVPPESSEQHVPETINKHDTSTEVVCAAEQPENNVSKVIKKSIGIQIPDEYLSSDQFPINVDLARKVFEVGIPAAYVLEPLNAELDKFEAENEKNTQLQRIRLKLEAFLKPGGFLVNGIARGQFRESFVLNPISRKKHYTPWVSITAVGLAELDATVVDETICVNLTKLNISGEEDQWYKKLVKYAFEFLFKTKLVAKINDALSQINGVKIQQLFFQVKGDEKLRKRAQELGLSPSRLDELLELVEVNARVSPDYLWLYVQL